jgi:parallel beta-helix repeat protein
MVKFSLNVVVSCAVLLSAFFPQASAQTQSTSSSILSGGKHAKPSGGYKRIAGVVDVVAFPAADGGDQADALQALLDNLQQGQRLVLTPGTYVVGHSLNVRSRSAIVSGYGATFVATNANDQSIAMTGRNSTVAGLTLRGTGTTRLETATSAKISVSGSGIQVLDVTIQGGASAGIFVSGGASVAIVGNKVLSTLADGIHITGGSSNVLVKDNTVTGTGDDMLAVVSYQKDGALNRNVLLTGNALSGNPWGRGISVVGGADVTITGNTVQGVQKAAGILIAQEDGYRTYGVSNVLIVSNVVTDIENSTSPGNDRPPAQHAAIDMNTGSGLVNLVSVTGNQIARANFGGVRALDNVCQYRISGNAFTAIAGTPVSLQSRGCSPSQIICGANTLDGSTLAPPVGCSATGTLSVTGADASRLPQIRTSLRQTQQTSINSKRAADRS